MLQQPGGPKPGPATGSGLYSLGLECGGRCRWPEPTSQHPKPQVQTHPSECHRSTGHRPLHSGQSHQIIALLGRSVRHLGLATRAEYFPLVFSIPFPFLFFLSLASRGSCPLPSIAPAPFLSDVVFEDALVCFLTRFPIV